MAGDAGSLESAGDWLAWPVAESVGDGVSVGGGVVAVELSVGLGEGEGDVGVDDEVTDGDGDGVGVALVGWPDLQLAELFGDALPLWPNGPLLPFGPPELPDDGADVVELPPASGVPLLPVDWIIAVGTVVAAKDRPATTTIAAASPAAGRSHLTMRVSSASGRNRSTTAPKA